MKPKKRRDRSPQTFRQRDLSRVLRAYRYAGEPQPNIRITKTGEIFATPQSAAPGEANDRANEWDDVLNGKNKVEAR